jgi:hypothetical protein
MERRPFLHGSKNGFWLQLVNVDGMKRESRTFDVFVLFMTRFNHKP